MSGERRLDDVRFRWLLAAVVVMGVLLRLRGIVSFPLSQDEMYTYFEARYLFATRLEPGIEARPLYYFLQHGVAWLVPDSIAPDRHPAVLRALPLLFGVSGIWAVWKLGENVGGQITGLAAAVLVSVSPWHLFASGMARYWSLVFLLACLTFWRLLEARRTGRQRDHLVAALFVALGLATHPTFAFPLVGCLLALRFDRSQTGWRFSWPSRAERRGFWFPVAALATGGIVTLVVSGNADAARNWTGRDIVAVQRLLPAMVQWADPLIVTAGIVGAGLPLVTNGHSSTRRIQWSVLSLGGIASGVLLLIVAALDSDVYADYGVALLPLILVSAGLFVSVVAERAAGSRRWLVGATLVVVLSAVVPSTLSHLMDGTRFDFRPAFERIQSERPEIPVYVKPIVQQRWYASRLRGIELRPRPDWMDEQLVRSPAWVVVPVRRYGIVGDDGGRFRRWLSESCVLRMEHEGTRFDFRMYRLELHLCSAQG